MHSKPQVFFDFFAERKKVKKAVSPVLVHKNARKYDFWAKSYVL